MNDNFKCIYKILKTLEKAMDYTEYDFSCISHEALGVSKERWSCYIRMMEENGYIKGAVIHEYVDGGCRIDISGMRITLKGLEYLTENNIMQKLYRAAKGIVDIASGAKDIMP